jgi:cell division protein FtsW
MPLRQRFDRVLLGAAILQTTVGLAILASASWLIATERYGLPGSYFFSWQAATALIGLVVLLITMHLKPEVLDDRRLQWVGLGVVSVLLAAAFLAPPVANTHRWISLGGLSVQPSVLARMVLVVFAAAELERARTRNWRVRPLLVLALVTAALAALIVAEPDLGSSALLLLVVGAMAFVAGTPKRYFVLPAAAALGGLALAILSSPYRMARVRAFLDPETASAAGWQSQQSLVALGSGGLLGTGYGAGLQKLFFLPEPHTDFIFAITGEELGLAGVVVLIGLAAVVTWRGLAIAMRLKKPAHALIAFGLSFAFAVQSLVHMVVCLALLPPKGIPLPLVSYGKTDLVVSLASVGLLLALSREVAR